MPEPFVFTRLYPPRPLDPVAVEHLMLRLMATDVPRPIAFEVHAQDGGLQYVLGCAPTAVHQLKRLIAGTVDGAVFGSANRAPVTAAAHVSTPKSGLPLGTPLPERVAGAVHAALASRAPGEALVLQLVLAAARSSTFVPAGAQDPLQSIPERLWQGSRAAHAELRRKLAEHAAEPRLDVTLRVGVSGPDPARRRALVLSLFGALQQLQAVGVTLRLNREPAAKLTRAQPGRPGLQLTPRELAAVLAWPVGDQDYPGVDPLHPKRLPMPNGVTGKEGVFAVSTAPGPQRHVGMTAQGRLFHTGVLAPTGSGKSEAILAPLLLDDVRAGRPVVLVDPKGQLVEYVLDCLEPECADRVVVFDPSDPEGTAKLNPFDIGNRDPFASADGVMAVFKSVFREGWGPRTEDILHSSVLTLMIDGQRRGQPHTLPDVPRLLTDAAFRRSVVGAIAGEPEIARFWGRYESLSPAQQEHEVAAPMNKLRRYLMRRGVTAILGTSVPAFRLRDVWTSDAIVLVALNEGLGGAETSKLIGGLICTEVFIAAQERAAEKDPKSRPGFVYVDEIARFLHLPIPLGSALEISRSYGIGWALFGQGMYQLNSDLAEAFEANTGNKIAFRTQPREARLIARQAPELSVEDILGLPRYEIYANLQTAQGSSGWFSARTLPPPQRLGHGPALREASRERHRDTAAAIVPIGQSTTANAPLSASAAASSHVKRRRT